MKVAVAANCLIEQPVPNLFRIREVTSYLGRDLYPHCDFRAFPESLQEMPEECYKLGCRRFRQYHFNSLFTDFAIRRCTACTESVNKQ